MLRKWMGIFGVILILTVAVTAAEFKSPKGISFYYPDGWRLISPDSDQPQEIHLIVNYWDNDDFREMVTIEIFDGSLGEPGEKTLDEIRKTSETYMKEKGHELKQATYELKTFRKHKITRAYLEVFNSTLQKELSLEQVRIHGDRYWYQLTFACKKDEYDHFNLIFTRLMNSLEIQRMYLNPIEKLVHNVPLLVGIPLGLIFILVVLYLVIRLRRRSRNS